MDDSECLNEAAALVSDATVMLGRVENRDVRELVKRLRAIEREIESMFERCYHCGNASDSVQEYGGGEHLCWDCAKCTACNGRGAVHGPNYRRDGADIVMCPECDGRQVRSYVEVPGE